MITEKCVEYIKYEIVYPDFSFVLVLGNLMLAEDSREILMTLEMSDVSYY